MEYQEGYRDGIRCVMMWMMTHQFDMEFPAELIEWIGETVHLETKQLSELNEEARLHEEDI